MPEPRSCKMSRPILPVELFELMIDSVDDERTLQTTSLVCKAWLIRSRYNLFRIVDLTLPNQLDRFAELLEIAPHIARCVEELAISENSLLGLFRPSLTIIARLPHSLSKHPLLLPKRLTVHNQLWLPTRYDPRYLEALSRFHSVTSLDLFDVSFTTIADFSIVLRALGKTLRTLSAKHVDCQRRLDTRHEALMGTDMPFLNTLHVHSVHPTHPIDWLFKYNGFSSLQVASIDYELSKLDTRPEQGLGVFLARTGSTVECLSLSLSKDFNVQHEILERQLDASECTALRVLRLDCRHERGVTPDWSWLLYFLSHLPGPNSSLRRMELFFQHSSHALATLHTFTADLDHILAGSRFSAALESVIFKFEHRLPGENHEDDVTLLSRFPSLRKKRLIHIS